MSTHTTITKIENATLESPTIAKIKNGSYTLTLPSKTATLATTADGYLTSHQSLDSCVKNTGAETIAGVKTFSSAPKFSTNTLTNSSGNTITLPSAAGTLATLDDISSSSGGGGGEVLDLRDKTEAEIIALMPFPSTATSIIFNYNQKFGNITTCKNMFNTMRNLSGLAFHQATFANATNLSQMFRGCTSLSSCSLPYATFGSATTAESMFSGCYALTNVSIPVGNFYTATDITYMFHGCRSLQNLSLPVATFSNVEKAYGMFMSNYCLRSINLPKVDFSKLTLATDMFNSCWSLREIIMPENSMAKLKDYAASAKLEFASGVNPSSSSDTIRIFNTAWNYSSRLLTVKSME